MKMYRFERTNKVEITETCVVESDDEDKAREVAGAMGFWEVEEESILELGELELVEVEE